MINKHTTHQRYEICAAAFLCDDVTFRDGMMIWRARWCTLYTLFSLVWRMYTMMQFNDTADDSDEIQRKKHHHEANQRKKEEKKKKESVN